MNQSKKVKILFFDILTSDKKLKRLLEEKIYHGVTYSDVMRRAFGLSKRCWTLIDATAKTSSINFSKFDGLVISGSIEDPVFGHEKPWMKMAYSLIKQAITAKIPILGICGGLQFTVRALDGRIIFNPKGRELGSISLSLTKAGMRDPLFRGLQRAKRFIVQSSHKCIAQTPLPRWKVLASSDLCDMQAIGIGKHIRLVQFHPEMTAVQISAIALIRKNALIKEGFARDENEFKKFIASIKGDKEIGKKILNNFIAYFVLPHKRRNKIL